MFGRYLNEFEVGDVFKHFPAKTITESDNNLFALLTMNHHPIHIDEQFANKHQHGKILVVGTYVFSLVVGQSVRDISGKAIANLEYESIKHLNPTFIGDTIYSQSTIISKRVSKTKPDRGILYVETEAKNQNNIDVLSFRRCVLIPVSEENIN
jgi:acyl dehydratase